MRKSKVYIALMHYPMYNKRKQIITTSVTNLDLHDIARAARTYDVDGFYVVHPSPAQHELINRIISYWQDGYGGIYNPDRKQAFDLIYLAVDLREVIGSIEAQTGKPVLTVATDASVFPDSVGYSTLREKIFLEEQAFLLMFGTGWGIEEDIIRQATYVLEPIEPYRDYNHLSVRSAVSIILDRLLGEDWYN
ncbi:MAG: RNA methyltransferase [Syntrophomonadaceae bacterium]